MSLLTGLGLACFATTLFLAFAVPLQWTTFVCLPCIGLGLVFLVWGEVRRSRPHGLKRKKKSN